MNSLWASTAITKVLLAVHVMPNSAKHIHKNRKYHGFVLNDADSIKDYCFSDGQVLHTQPNALFYLPKGSSYYVRTIRAGGCYAINFDAQIADSPFCVTLRNPNPLKKSFQAACDSWLSHHSSREAAAMRAIYDGICHLCREEKKRYMSSAQHEWIRPAMEKLEHGFTDSTLSVAQLAAQCGISEVYFRRLFFELFGISPKAYIIEKRMEYAVQLLASGELAISQVATRCGYPEPCHFSREFKKRYGVPPKNYQV